MKNNIRFSFLACTIVFLTWSNNSFAQVKTNISSSSKYSNYLKEYKSSKKKYRKYYKDSLKSLKSLNKVYDRKIDSLWTAYSTDLWTSAPLDSVPLDSMQSFDINQILQQKYDMYEASYISKIDGDYNISIDSIEMDTAEYVDSDQLIESLEQGLLSRIDPNFIPELQAAEMSALEAQKQINEIKQSFNRYKDHKNLKHNIGSLSNADMVSTNNALNSAHKKLTTLKKKYGTVPSVNNLTDAKKRNSLEDLRFGRRLIIGGNLHIRHNTTVDIDFAPSLAYRLNRLFSVGMEGVYRTQFGGGNPWHESVSPNTFGGRLFSEHDIYKSLFAHLELESLHRTSSNEFESNFLTGAMGGIGKSFSFGKTINGKVIIQYNFIYKEDQFYSSPWVFRFGFDLKKIKPKSIINRGA